MKENAVTAKLIKHLNGIPECYARKRHGGAFCVGDPDIHICFRGKTIMVEMKLDTGELSEIQAVMLGRWQAAGAACILSVWVPALKRFALYINPDNWMAYAKKAKMLPEPDGYVNTEQWKEMLTNL